MIAYLHNLSPVKTSQRSNLYFDFTLQTENRTFRSVCFSPEKHSQLSTKFEASSPIKLSKFQVKRNTRNDQDEIHINKQTRLEDSLESEVTFDIKNFEPEEKCKPGLTTVNNLLKGDTNVVANVSGRVTFQGPKETDRHQRYYSPCLMGE